jgi:hypothetical protein
MNCFVRQRRLRLSTSTTLLLLLVCLVLPTTAVAFCNNHHHHPASTLTQFPQAHHDVIHSTTVASCVGDGNHHRTAIQKRINLRRNDPSIASSPTTCLTALATTTSSSRRKWMIGSFLTGWTTTMMSNTAYAASPTLSNTPTTDLSQRLQTLTLQQPTIGTTTYNSVGNDMTVYPYYMEGTWDVTQTLIRVETPMGLQYAGGPNGILDIARKSIQESQSQLGKPVHLQLRYIQCRPKQLNTKSTNAPWKSTTDGSGDVVVLEDRLYNTRQRLNQFAGTAVVANVQYADTQGSNQNTMNALYECTTTTEINAAIPLTTTLTYFKGPAAQKVFVLGHHNVRAVPKESYDTTTMASLCSSSSSAPAATGATSLPAWTGYEYQRSIFALTNGSTAPPITTDTELIFQYTPIMMDCTASTSTTMTTTASSPPINCIRGKLRIVGYLNPNDKYYFDVQNRAVTIQDYTLDMKRIIA